MRTKSQLAFAASILAGCSLATAQNNPSAAQSATSPSSTKPAAAPAAAPKPTVRKAPSQVDQVIQLVKAGMSEGIIIKTLQKNTKPVDLSTADLVRLKEAGVSENIMMVMMDPTANPSATAPAPANPAPAPVEAVAPIAPPPAPAPVAPPPPPPVQAAAPPPASPKPITGDWRAAIEQRISAAYPLTQPTGDKTSIVTAGAVIVLQKNTLSFYAAGSLGNANTYKGGKLSGGFMGALCVPPNCRKFVKGEKFWLTDISAKDDGLVLSFLSDPLPDARFGGSVKFPWTKGTQHTPEEMLALVAEVITVDGSSGPAPAAPAPGAPQQTLAPIAPPPPPADQPGAPPASIAVGQSKDQVIAALGQPSKIANLGPKQILFFQSLKVTLVNGKVTEVQ